MNLLRFFLISSLIASITLVTPVHSASDSPRIVYPADNISVGFSKIRVIGYAPAGTSKVVIRLKSGKDVQGTSLNVNMGTFTSFINLKPGLNVIEVPDDRMRPIDSRKIFYLPAEAKIQKPENFQSYYLHDKIDLASKCIDCHDLKNQKKVNYQRVNLINTCITAQCHATIGKAKYVHGPVAGQTCVACHNLHGSTNKGFMSRIDNNICDVCHAEEEGFVKNSNNSKGKCLSCHDPHQSESQYHLKPGYEIKGTKIHNDFSTRRGEK